MEFVEEALGAGKQPVREVAGIDKQVLRAFSSRRAAIEDTYLELVARYRAQHGYEPPKRVQLHIDKPRYVVWVCCPRLTGVVDVRGQRRPAASGGVE